MLQEKKNPKKLDDPGQSQHVNFFRPGVQQGFGTFLNGSAGREDIVNEEDLSTGHGPRGIHLKGTPNVLMPLGTGQPRLRSGLPDSIEGREVQGNRPPFAHLSGQEEGLVEAALAKTPGMEGNGNDEVDGREGEFWVPVFSHHGPQGSGETGDPAEFKARDGFDDPSFVSADGTGLPKGPFACQAAGAEMILLGGRGKADAASEAKRGGEECNPGEAGGTGTFAGRRVEGAPAERTFGRQKKIQQGAPEGGGAHVFAGKL